MKKLLKFEKNDCAPCEQVSQYLNDKGIEYETIKPYDTPELATKHKVRTVPTLILMDGDKEAGRVIGFKPLEIDNLLS